MQLTRYKTVEDFKAAGGLDFLCAHEAENNLPISICGSLEQDQRSLNSEPYFLGLIHHQDQIAVALLRTPPFNAVFSLSQLPNEQIPSMLEAAAAGLGELYPALPGLLAPAGVAEAAARTWAAKSGQSFSKGMSQRIYKIEQVSPPEGVPGELRSYSLNDRYLALAWMENFYRAALQGEPPLDRFRRNLSLYEEGDLDKRGLFFWKHQGRLVSMAGYTGPTPRGFRVNCVYTPESYRNQGFASAVTAAATQAALDRGKQFCFLFTDLANPTSNSIYQKIGYQPVLDMQEMLFKDEN